MTEPGEPSYLFVDPQPFAHQREALDRLLRDGGVHALLHDPGCGKSRVVVDYACLLASARHAAGLGEVRLLIVCPRDVQDTWATQFATFAPAGISLWIEQGRGQIRDKAQRLRALGSPQRPQRVSRATRLLCRPAGAASPDELPGPRVVAYVTNIDSFASTRADQGARTVTLADRMVAAVRDARLDVLVADESHRLKSPTGNAARALARAARHVRRRILLTGTPMPHGPLDVWAQWRILDPLSFSTRGDPWGFGRFRAEYAEMGGWMGREITGYRNLDDLQDRLAYRSSVVRKADALDLPPTLDIEHPIELTPREIDAYEQMRTQLLARLGSGELTTADNRLVQMLRLRQITSGYTRIDGQEAPVELGPGKRARCYSLLEDLLASEHRIVIFAWGLHEIEALAAELRARAPHGAQIRLISGAIPQAERIAIRAEFGRPAGEERIVLLAQIRTMSLGINELVTASHAIFLSLSQMRDDYVQAKARLDRQGQLLPVTFHHLIALGTIDEIILRTHRERGNLEDALLAHLRQGQPLLAGADEGDADASVA